MPETENLKRKCKQDACTVSTDGKCLEGLDPDKCPHHFYLKSEDELASNSESSDKSSESNKSIPLFNGVALTSKETPLITYKVPCEKIFIVGESGCGKTTFLATIFDSFQKAPINNIFYAGSYTQIGFEERCHLSRLISNAAVPDTEKTSTREFKFLHLAVKKLGHLEKPALNFLISDISGERLQLARDSSSAIQELNILDTATDIIYIIDGEKLSDRKTRQATLFNAYTFIRRSLDDNILGPAIDLKIVISKWDTLCNDTSFDFDSVIVKYFKEQFGGRFKSLSFAKVAARPKKAIGEVTYGYGVFELLNEWVEKAFDPVIENYIVEKHKGERYFDNFNN